MLAAPISLEAEAPVAPLQCSMLFSLWQPLHARCSQQSPAVAGTLAGFFSVFTVRFTKRNLDSDRPPVQERTWGAGDGSKKGK